MKNIFPLRYLIISFILFLTGCGLVLPPMDPVPHNADEIKGMPVMSPEKIIELKEPMTFADKYVNAKNGIKLPIGVYNIEAEDENYYYFRAPAEIGYRNFHWAGGFNDRFISGGLALGKVLVKVYFVPAFAYRTIDEKTKVMTWKFGSEFLVQESKVWQRNY